MATKEQIVTLADFKEEQEARLKEGPGDELSLRLASRMGAFPNHMHSLGSAAMHDPFGVVLTFDSVILVNQRRLLYPGDLGVQQSPFGFCHPEVARRNRQALLKNQDEHLADSPDDGTYFSAYICKQLGSTKFTLAVSMDTTQSVLVPDRDEALLADLARVPGLEKMVQMTQAPLEGKERPMVRFSAAVIQPKFENAADGSSVQCAEMEEYPLFEVECIGYGGNKNMHWDHQNWYEVVVDSLKELPFGEGHTRHIKFNVTAWTARKLASYTFTTAKSPLVMLAKTGQGTTASWVTVAGNVPRVMCEIRAVDPASPASCGRDGKELDMRLDDYLNNISMTTGENQGPTAVLRLSGVDGPALTAMLAAAEKAKVRVDGPPSKMSVAQIAALHEDWMKKVEIVAQQDDDAGRMDGNTRQVFDQSSHRWAKVREVAHRAGRHFIRAEGGMNLDKWQEVPLQSLRSGLTDTHRILFPKGKRFELAPRTLELVYPFPKIDPESLEFLVEEGEEELESLF
jgi:hypothetical protein